jgi:AmmeMemoRadiSam system protein A
LSELNAAEQKLLLALARWTIAAELSIEPPGEFFPEFTREAGRHPLFEEKRGAFVTLRLGEALRGCIGSMVGRQPLHETIVSMARSSAFRDPRFPPLSRDEFERTSIEISVLSPLRRIDDPHTVQPGRDGLYIHCAGRSGVLLPQVAVEQGWDRLRFLEHTCLKAGLDKDAWMRDDAELEIFQAQVFSEEEQG